MKDKRRILIRLFIFSLMVVSSLCVPVMRRTAEAVVSFDSERIRTFSALYGQGKELRESVTVRPVKNAVQAEKRMSADFLVCGEMPLTCGADNPVLFAVSFIQNGFFYFKNKYIKFIVFIKTLL